MKDRQYKIKLKRYLERRNALLKMYGTKYKFVSMYAKVKVRAKKEDNRALISGSDKYHALALQGQCYANQLASSALNMGQLQSRAAAMSGMYGNIGRDWAAPNIRVGLCGLGLFL